MKKVLVAMSGGVDSSLAAALLKRQGYFVAGAYMKNFSPESWEGVVEADCPWERDVADAQAVCEKLGIEFRSFNFEKEYREKVIDYFFNEYAAGRTPNPDVMCNKEIKFGLFLEKVRKLGFDYVATGHYARIKNSSQPPLWKRGGVPSLLQREGKGEFHLLKGLDPKKDQSYFLYTLNQDQLSRILFPIGEYTKAQVRQMAKEFGLPNWDKKDSQGVCFVGHIKLREFLRQRIPEKIGEIVDAESGRIIGRHPGAWYYTVGQREGIGIGARLPSLRSGAGGQGGTEPLYVTRKDVINNVITVSAKSLNEGLYSNSALVKNVHWVNHEPSLHLSCYAKIRYQQPDQTCTVSLTNTEPTQTSTDTRPPLSADSKSAIVRVRFAEPQFAIAPGQSIVFYDGDLLLGGGIIETN